MAAILAAILAVVNTAGCHHEGRQLVYDRLTIVEEEPAIAM
jgi:hypothetical protein